MSERPHIVSDHEHGVEEEIQGARRDRDRAMAETTTGATESATGSAAALPDEEIQPVVRSFSRGPAGHEVPAPVRAWIAAEDAAQMQHYRRIYREIDALAPLRDVWVEEFFERITGPRGYSVHAGTRRTIARDDIPERPDRPWRLVW